MSRSRRKNRCSRGRGCGVCGNAGEAREKRYRSHAKADGHDLPKDPDAKNTDGWDIRPRGFHAGKSYR